MTYLSMEGPNEEEEAQAIRKQMAENGLRGLLESLPRWMGFERRMIEHLLSDDHVGAFRVSFPPTSN